MKRRAFHGLVAIFLVSNEFYQHDHKTEAFVAPNAFRPTIHRRAASPLPTQTRTPYTSSLVQLNGIRGFRSWFESQFPNAMFTVEHSHIKKKSENFHHVLIDMNQLLHITLRRARSDEHALTLLIKELDTCMTIASPTRSIVLAFDGPPAAAKLATQRRRRLGTVLRADRKKARLELLKKRGLVPRQKDILRRRDKAAKEEETLKITPGTTFMDKAHAAVLYWAWQRLEIPNGKISKCRIYLSPSSVPGEGEVKLLDWLIQAGSEKRLTRVMRKGELEMEYHKRIVKPGESVAILGGDSDLVLEGLVIPPSITHNVFVILPSSGKISYVVSLWETTLTLGKFLGKKFDPKDIMRVRTDLVLLLIMNGNDYLPKLRGSAGFNKLFHTYLNLLKHWIAVENEHQPYLVDPDTLEFNLPFCVSFFKQLASMAPKQLKQTFDVSSSQNSVTALSQLHSMSDAGFLPSPVEFKRIQSSLDHQDTLRLTLGEDKDDEQCLYFDLKYDAAEATPLKKLKQALAHMALVDLLGDDYMDLNDCFIDDTMCDDDDDADQFDYSSNNSGSYPWEIMYPASSSVDEYLRGLLWNLSTYQDGVCSDYGYNYGRRMSPTAEEIVSYFEEAQGRNTKVDRNSLQGETFVEPLSAGLSCLAALPSQVDFLIPSPYRHLSANGRIEQLYTQCIDPTTNVFDINLFQVLCCEAMQEIGLSTTDSDWKSKEVHRKSNLRKIPLGDTFWTVIHRVRTPLKHPFEPPAPFSDRLHHLRFNNCIKVSHILATDKPRWLQNQKQVKRRKKRETNEPRTDNTSRHGIVGELLTDNKTNLEAVGYKMVYQSAGSYFPTERNRRSNAVVTSLNQDLEMPLQTLSDKGYHAFLDNDDLFERPKQNIDGLNAMECLKQLHDAKCFDQLEWTFTTLSNVNYISDSSPGIYEQVQLSIHLSEEKKLVMEKDRNTRIHSRKRVKHALASDALDNIFQDCSRPWHEMSVQQKKEILSSPTNSGLEKENISALQRLNELSDARIIDISWEVTTTSSDSMELVRLHITTRSNNMIFISEDTRDPTQDSKATLKQRLANDAITKLLEKNKEHNWKTMSLSEMKDVLK